MPDGLHGQLPGDDKFRAEWSEYFSLRLRSGLGIDDAYFMARRLQTIALEKAVERTVSLAAASDLQMFGIMLERSARRFADTHPGANAFRVQVPENIELNRLAHALLGVFDEKERDEFVRRMHWDVRQAAHEKLNACRSGDIDGWPRLWGAWLEYILAEKLVNRWWPAEAPGTAQRTDVVARLFSDEEYRRLSKEDAELEEAHADIVTTMTLYATDEAQEKWHRELLETAATRGRFEARALLREMRQEFRVAPWNYIEWDAELKQPPRDVPQEPERGAPSKDVPEPEPVPPSRDGNGDEGAGVPDDRPLGPAPQWMYDEEALRKLKTDDLDAAAREYLKRQRDLLAPHLADGGAGLDLETANCLAALHEDVRSFLAGGSEQADLVTAAMRLNLATRPIIATRAHAAGRLADAVDLMRPLLPIVLILGGAEICARLGVHLAFYAAQDFLIDHMKQVEEDMFGLAGTSGDAMLTRAAMIARSYRCYRVGDMRAVADAAQAARSGRNDWLDRYAEGVSAIARDVLGGTDDAAESGGAGPAHILEQWTAARLSGNPAELSRLLPKLLEWGAAGSPVERAMALGEAAVALARARVSEGWRWALSAADAIDESLSHLGSAKERNHLLSVLRQTLDNILDVLLQASKLGDDAADRGAYAWIRRLQGSPDLPEGYRNLTLAELVARHRGQDEAARTRIWRFECIGYDLRFLSCDERIVAGWRFIFDPDGDVMMEPFRFSADAAAVMKRHLTDPAEPRTDQERASLRESLFGPWIDLRLEVGLPLDGPILVRRAPEIAGLDLERLAAAAGSLPAWPVLCWFDQIDEPVPGEEGR